MKNDKKFFILISFGYFRKAIKINLILIAFLFIETQIFSHEINHSLECTIQFENVLDAKFSPDGKHILAGNQFSIIRVWNTNSGEIINTYTKHSREISGVEFLLNKDRIISTSLDGTIRLWSQSTGKSYQSFEGPPFVSLALSPNGQYALTGSPHPENSARLWDLQTHSLIKIFHHENEVRAVNFSAKGDLFLTGSMDGVVNLWDSTSLTKKASLQTRAIALNCALFSPDNNFIIIGDAKGDLILWNYSNQSIDKKTNVHEDSIFDIDVSRDGEILLTGSMDHTAKLWDLKTLRCVAAIDGHQNGVFAVDFSSNDTSFLTGSFDNTIKIWNITQSNAYLWCQYE